MISIAMRHHRTSNPHLTHSVIASTDLAHGINDMQINAFYGAAHGYQPFRIRCIRNLYLPIINASFERHNALAPPPKGALATDRTASARP